MRARHVEALRAIAAGLQDAGSAGARTEVPIAREEARRGATGRVPPWLRGKRAASILAGVRNPGPWSRPCRIWGMVVVAVRHLQVHRRGQFRIRRVDGEDAILLDEGNARQLLDVAYQQKADLMIAGGRNMYTAYKAVFALIERQSEREYAFAGW